MGEWSGCVAAAGNAKRDIFAWNQLYVTGFIEQARVCPGLERMQHIKLICVSHVIEQCDRWKGGIDCPVPGECSWFRCKIHHHSPPRKLSIRRYVSYSATKLPPVMTAKGDRPLKNSLWLTMAMNPSTFSG